MITLFEKLSALFPESSKNSLRQWLQDGRVYVDNQVVKKGTVEIKDSAFVELREKKKFLKGRTLPIVYEDPFILVLNKPAGLLSVATETEDKRHLFGYVKDYLYPKRAYVVHRLDRETSGLIVFAKTEDAFTSLKEQLKKHTCERIYRAVVEGHLEVGKGTWKSYLKESPSFEVYSTKEGDGELAITHYQVLKQGPDWTELELRLETGKKNQIRVHCKDAGIPIIGDDKYGGRKIFSKRLLLHAEQLNFIHPKTGKRMEFFAPLPYELNKYASK